MEGPRNHRKELKEDEIVAMLNTGYANSVVIQGSPWARRLASWHVFASQNQPDEKCRREVVNRFIERQMRLASPPHPLEVDLLNNFAGTARASRLANPPHMRAKPRPGKKEPKKMKRETNEGDEVVENEIMGDEDMKDEAEDSSVEGKREAETLGQAG